MHISLMYIYKSLPCSVFTVVMACVDVCAIPVAEPKGNNAADLAGTYKIVIRQRKGEGLRKKLVECLFKRAAGGVS